MHEGKNLGNSGRAEDRPKFCLGYIKNLVRMRNVQDRLSVYVLRIFCSKASLAASGRPVQDHRVKRAALYRGPKRRVGAEEMLLPGELVERPRAHPRGERLPGYRAGPARSRCLLGVEQPFHSSQPSSALT